jgi:pSer/pThr/pTyr-binding forkhead associated (FHA) protein
MLVEDEGGEQREVFRLTDPFTSVGRRSDDPQLRTTVALSDVPHVSRRHLALLWEERGGEAGFRVFNLGLNPVHLSGEEIPGAHVGRGALDLASIDAKCTGWLPPGVPLRIGEHGPILKIEEVPEEVDEDEDVPDDPDATRFG